MVPSSGAGPEIMQKLKADIPTVALPEALFLRLPEISLPSTYSTPLVPSGRAASPENQRNWLQLTEPA